MEEILLSAGFIDKGLCAVCGGRARRFEKTINGRPAVCTIKAQQMSKFVLRFGSEIIRGDASNLDHILTIRGLK